MPKPKVVLVDPVQQWDTWELSAHSLLEPLGLELIGAVLRDAGHDVRVIQAQGRSLASVAEAVEAECPFLVGITSYSYNACDAVALARDLRSRCPGAKIVFGGYHATFVHDALKDGDADYIVLGPGEGPMLSLASELERGGDITAVPSLAFLGRGGRVTVTTHKGGQRVNVGVLPLRDARILERCVVSGLIYPPPSRQVSAAAVLASRGCPFSCTYCASPAFYGCHIDKRPPREVAAEVVDLSRRFGTNMVYFTDLTFNLDPSYTEAICDSLMAARSRVKWYALFRPSGVDRALAQKLRLAGCSRVSVGIEFTEVDLLACTHRGGPDYMRTVKTCLENLDEAGIITRGLVMVGHPRETETMRDALLRQLTSLPLDDLRVGVLTPFPGSVFYDQMVRERRLLTRDFRLFDARHAVTGLNEADARQTEQAAQRLFHAFHSDPDHNERLDRKAVTNREFAEALAEYRAASRTSGVRRRTGEKKGVS